MPFVPLQYGNQHCEQEFFNVRECTFSIYGLIVGKASSLPF